MFKIENQEELISCFRPLDRESVVLTKEIGFPLYVRDYLAWTESSGARTYLVFPEPTSGKLLGVSFRRDAGRGPAPYFCDWCHSTGNSSEIGLLTADASARRRVGVHACLDLACGKKIDQRSHLTGQNARQETRAVLDRMGEFTRKTLF